MKMAGEHSVKALQGWGLGVAQGNCELNLERLTKIHSKNIICLYHLSSF